jgi:hypothetical protein
VLPAGRAHACPQILFLNKDDLFRQKVQTSDIKNFFPVRSPAAALHSH